MQWSQQLGFVLGPKHLSRIEISKRFFTVKFEGMYCHITTDSRIVTISVALKAHCHPRSLYGHTTSVHKLKIFIQVLKRIFS